jgi:hypothetical protein
MGRPARTSLFEASNLCKLTELLSQIHTRKTALVDFQRDFVWKLPMNSGPDRVDRSRPRRRGHMVHPQHV